MKKHTRVYLDYFGCGEQDVILCEVCGNQATDIHHIEDRGMGGSKTKDYIENLIGLCRECHNKAHGIGGKIEKETLRNIHLKNLKSKNLKFTT